jgi:hypothetical protein
MSPGIILILRVVAAIAGLLLLAWAGFSAYRDRRRAPIAVQSAAEPDRRRVYDAIISQAEYARATGKQEIANAAVMAFTDLVRIEVKS